ncbi:hypothetical protein [Pseudoalteromonas luteoviolacea]|uniref:Uncharacterized protein n=2 Tax=Pseudoalteromonas luteoviolacea TaxID=43657 RepID=A0A167KSR7_9GAMM|nr:hypothetical protein [Pseudoalteromonas luteoviolacea]AOT10023.1 hypothetical protein S4054249_20370 [Pseudoalteromonas luteoviolacea]AOT14934.1 hypothetical protein S40542_20340 [Pseudoalteromonas luteoviolacea]AOT19850.1 hypothetical protein S4054_20345 [Pseudoalteromonas luteoviolacea]KKE84895.1 hypothetical protein N479_07295 [Pseudoalteromonas luteoviolacea S4054]KZN63215.1 hypothetical protein N473_17460 [Pseudoalteromonas luteoviolacea CPMOR-1]
MVTPQVLCQFQPRLDTQCQRPYLDAPVHVANFIEDGFKLAKWYEKKPCVLLQELYLRRVFFELLNHIADPLVHQSFRQQCFEQLHKPLLALKRFYKKQHRSMAPFYRLEREARIISHEFNPFN